MKTVFIILCAFLFMSGNASAIDRSRYESSEHKFRSQFTDSEWQRHQQVHERFLRESSFYNNSYDDDDDDYHYHDYHLNDYRHDHDHSIKYRKMHNDDWRYDCDDRRDGNDNSEEHEHKHWDGDDR